MHKQSTRELGYARVLATDTLPYETPLFFTNEKLWNALAKDKPFTGLPSIAKSLLDHNSASQPFSYSVHKGSGSRRNLSIPHPASQIRFAELYRDFDGFIQNLCSRSSYSLRYPSRIGSHYFKSQYAASDSASAAPDPDPTSFYSERQWASTYFSYRDYTQMYRFFSSPEFGRLELKHDTLLQIDVSKCFESIYTHSLAWAVRGKEFSKDTINTSSFESKFDLLMRNSNWAQTNGILIGPEVCRVFAEIILQCIDLKIEKRVLLSKERVAIRRYIDDYLIFGNSEKSVRNCKEIIVDELQGFNLHLNQSKERLTTRPLVSLLTIAREEVNKEIGAFLELAKVALRASGPGESPPHYPESASIHTISEIRKICRKHDVSYASVVSPALAVIFKGLQRLRRRSGAPKASPNAVPNAYEILSETLAVAHFLFLLDIRVATSHKLAKVYFEIDAISKTLNCQGGAIRSQIIDGMRSAINRAEDLGAQGPEILNILIAVDAVCPNSVTLNDLARCLQVSDSWAAASERMNYFDLVSVLYLARKRRKFEEARDSVIVEIQNRLRRAGSNTPFLATETLLFFDFVSCPHIDLKNRIKVVSEMNSALTGVDLSPETAKKQAAILAKSLGFVAWEGSRNFWALLQRKELQPAYD